ncbi:hypothetical protein Cgig2_002650 [Carnegiea gigantea]|uniref:Uncharacterized protein n=1 Tax=Carnegiea gigantea TaxID=171969 RepID=A0A9Q1GR96_9CARY|nr:hypothetical protein Cgig2_002650 [Carnegiea gigantea]
MNSNYGKTGTSFNNLDFDLGLRSNRSRSLNEQKNKSNPLSYTYTSSSSQSKPISTMPSWQPGKPSWTHQPAPSHTGATRTELGGTTSMVGDIFGKSWNSAAPTSSGSGAAIGIVNRSPNLFGDLLSSALGQNKTSSNAPLKSAPPVKSSFPMGGMADSLPKTNSSSVKSGQSPGKFSTASAGNSAGYGNSGMNKSSSLNSNSKVGAPSMRSMGGIGGGVGVGVSSNKDPFGSLVDFGSKPMGGEGLNSAAKTKSTAAEDVAFGNFQNASKPNSSASTFSSANSNPMASNSASVLKMDNFTSKNQIPAQPASADSFDMFFSSSSAAGGTSTATSDAQEFSGRDDWGFDSQFGGHDGGSTTELEGLPPPPAGVSASTAKAKGLDNYKHGQYADAIKWLSWAEVLLEKVGETSGVMEVLACRASCYKEVGEYKKAVADCTKVLDHEGKNVAVLVQRALLYESMEKYRLGAEDLRTVMKLDPGNRVARSTIHLSFHFHEKRILHFVPSFVL